MAEVFFVGGTLFEMGWHGWSRMGLGRKEGRKGKSEWMEKKKYFAGIVCWSEWWGFGLVGI